MKLSSSDLLAMGYDLDGNRLADQPKATTGAASREADLHEAIMEFCRARGFAVVHSRMDRPQTAKVGTPDFVIALPGGKTLWVEAKSRQGKLTMEQRVWMVSLGKLRHTTAVVRSIDEFHKLVFAQGVS